MDLKIVVDTADHLVVQGCSSQRGDFGVVLGLYATVVVVAYLNLRQHPKLRVLGWCVAAVATLVCGAFLASMWSTGGIRFDLEMDQGKGVWSTDAVFRKSNDFYREPVVRPLGSILRVDMGTRDSGGRSSSQRILVTLVDGTTLEPFGGEDRGSPNEYLVLDRMQKMLLKR